MPPESDAYTMHTELCDDAGVADLGALNRLRSLGGHEPYKGAPFACTGHAHLAGEHIECTSAFHTRRRREIPAHQVEGAALLRVALELQDFLKDEDVDPRLRADIDIIADVGGRLYTSTPITLTAGQPLSMPFTFGAPANVLPYHTIPCC